MSGYVSQELIDDLVKIGTIKNGVPIRYRGMFSELGLYVQMRSRMGMTSLKAGGMFISKINLWQQRPGDKWQVKKYKPGEWEARVKPTVELAVWLIKTEGWGGKKSELDFKEATQRFKKTGVLELPSTEEVEYFKAMLDLRQIHNAAAEVIRERLNLLAALAQSGEYIVFKDLNFDSETILQQCEILDKCFKEVKELKVPTGLELLNEANLALMQSLIRAGLLALDIHRLFYEGQGLSDVQAKIEECYEASREYSMLHQQEARIADQLAKEGV